MYDIIIYSATWCSACKSLKMKMYNAELNYEERMVDDPDIMAEAKSMGIRTLPTTIIRKDGNIVETIVGDKPVSVYEKYRNTHLEATTNKASLNG